MTYCVLGITNIVRRGSRTYFVEVMVLQYIKVYSIPVADAQIAGGIVIGKRLGAATGGGTGTTVFPVHIKIKIKIVDKYTRC